MPSSFINEHTAEFILVPRLIQILSKADFRITPIYYWASREGGVAAKNSFKGALIKVVALYARRPKIISGNTNLAIFKINQRLFDRSAFLQSRGIPALAGLPLATKLEDFHSEMICQWYYITPGEQEKNINIFFNNNAEGLLPLMTDDEIIRLVHSKSKEITWDDFKSVIRELNHIGNSRFSPFGLRLGDSYKPVYLLIQV